MHRRTRNLGKNLGSEKVGQLPLKDPVRVAPETSLVDTLGRMRTSKSGCALIEENDELVGIFTERDVLTRVIEAKISLKTPIAQVMTSEPKTLSIDSTIAQAVRVMDEGGYRNIPLTERRPDGRVDVVKVLSARDLVTYFGSNFPEEVYNLPPDPGQLSRAREGA